MKRKRFKSFNPHTHEGCDLIQYIYQGFHISFNPHTHEGCDNIRGGAHQQAIRFNPHTHEGCDHRHLDDVDLIVMFQSTHPRRV